jgi:hypothetical protein
MPLGLNRKELFAVAKNLDIFAGKLYKYWIDRCGPVGPSTQTEEKNAAKTKNKNEYIY